MHPHTQLGGTRDKETPLKATAESDHITVSALVICTETKSVLLVHHRLTEFLQLPGGHLDTVEESLHLAALREVKEETGIVATLFTRSRVAIHHGTQCPIPIDVRRHIAPADPYWGEPEYHHTDYLYLATADSRAPREEISDVVWIPIRELFGNKAVRLDIPPLAHLGLSMLGGTSWQ